MEPTRPGTIAICLRSAGTRPTESKAKIEAAFQQLFHGDKQTQAVYFEAGSNANGPLAYVTDWANNDARTEGMSYGMMIAVQLNKKHEFDAIWNWAHTYMLITDPKNPSVGYFAWSMNTDGTPRSTGAAPDGEEYYVMSLYFAAHRWGNGKGIYNYQAEADKILRGMRHHPVLSGTGPFRIHPEDPPFVPPNHPWPSPNETRREEAAAKAAADAAAKGEPAPKPPVFPRPRGPWTETIGPMVNENTHDSVCAERRAPDDRPELSPAGVLRAMGAMGTGGGPRVLGEGCGGEPRIFRESHGAGDGA